MTLTRAENALIKGGAVFQMKDRAVVFPHERLEGAGPRDLHEFRWAIVLQGPGDCQALEYPLVHVIPCSSSSTPARGTFPLPQEELRREGSPFTASNVLAYTNLVQPCLKIDLIKHQGNLLPETYGRLCAQVVRVLGLVSAAQGTPPTQGGLNLPPRVSTSSPKLQRLGLPTGSSTSTVPVRVDVAVAVAGFASKTQTKKPYGWDLNTLPEVARGLFSPC